MKHKGGVPPVFRKPQSRDPSRKIDAYALMEQTPTLPKPPPIKRQTVRSGLSQLLRGRPRSPFTDPGPNAGKRKRTRKNLKRRS